MSQQPTKGRGAVSQPPHRFQTTQTVPLDDTEEPLPVAPRKTELMPLRSASIISRNRSPDLPFDRSINPYQGCEHGCVYCYARPSHAYHDLSPGLDFETRIFYKPDAPATLLSEWSKPGYRCQPIVIGANTDPYQPAEKRLKITRRLLALFLEHRHPLSLITKGTSMTRDLDLLEQLAALRLCSVAISVPTANDELKRHLEPRVPSAAARFRLMKSLAERGVPVSLLQAPIIPAVNDMEIESIVARAAAAGANNASYIMLRLPHEVKAVFRDWLEARLPERAQHVMSLIRQASGGRDYDNRFGLRQTGRGPYANMIRQRFESACRKHGVANGRRRINLDTAQFSPPAK